MKWLRRWSSNRTPLTHWQQQQLQDWKQQPDSDLQYPLAEGELVVVDVETTGLDAKRDRLLSIGAVRVRQQRIELGGAFHVVLQQRTASEVENILIHGISPTEQAEGESPVDALLTFLQFIGKAPLVAYHAMFDRSFIGRALRHYLGIKLNNVWIDLAWLLPGLFENTVRPNAPLDEWLAHFNVATENRHSALADAQVTAELMLIAMHKAQQDNQPNLFALRSLAEGMAKLASGRSL